MFRQSAYTTEQDFYFEINLSKLPTFCDFSTESKTINTTRTHVSYLAIPTNPQDGSVCIRSVPYVTAHTSL